MLAWHYYLIYSSYSNFFHGPNHLIYMLFPQACYLLGPLIFTYIIIYALIYHLFVNFEKVSLYSKLCSQDEKIKMAKYELVPDLKNSLIPFLFKNILMDLNKSHIA